MDNTITPGTWAQFDRDGYGCLGPLLSDTELAALCQRIASIVLGRAHRRPRQPAGGDGGVGGIGGFGGFLQYKVSGPWH